MKTGKRILSVKFKRMIDESPDTSWLGEYSDTRKSPYSIDRMHSEDCPVNAGSDGALWVSSSSGRIELQLTLEQAESVSHSGQCDDDVKALSRVPEIAAQLAKIDAAILSAELRDYGAWDDDERADHEQNLQRILWLLGGDIAEKNGCQCGEHGDMERGQYRYFNPSFNYVDSAGNATDTPENVRKYTKQDYNRMESLNNGSWCFVGVKALAEIAIANGLTYWQTQTITSGGLWGIESDSDASYFEELKREQLFDLRAQLKALGFSTRAISQAFKKRFCG